jgi:amidase
MAAQVLRTLTKSRTDSIVPQEDLVSLALRAGLSIPSNQLDDYCALLSGLNHCAKEILTHEDYYPKVDHERYPRTVIHRPEDTDKGGWATKATVRSTKPLSDELKGVTIALKDNIALAGVPCTNGTAALDWAPEVDATLVTRILDAGGVITGKAACENNCFGAVR